MINKTRIHLAINGGIDELSECKKGNTMDLFTISDIISKIIRERGVVALENPSVFCAIIDDYAPSLVLERKIIRRALTPNVSAKLIEIYYCEDDKPNYLMRLNEYLKSELGMSQEWVESFISAFSDAFGWGYICSNKVQVIDNSILYNNQKRSIVDRNLIPLLSKQISAGYCFFLAVCEGGRVIAIGDNRSGQCRVSSWDDVIKVDAGTFHSLGLKNDGTVYSTEIPEPNRRFDFGQCNVSTWNSIVDIGAGLDHSVGLKSDGTVLATGNNKFGQCNVDGWKDIISISVNGCLTVGLKSDGTVLATGLGQAQQTKTMDWKNVIFVSSGKAQSVGIDKKGAVLATNYVGSNYHGQCELKDFHDVIMISSSSFNTVGLKSDGSVLSTKYQGDPKENYGQCNVSEWENIIAVASGGTFTVGLRLDGKLEAVGLNSLGQCNVSGCKVFYDQKAYFESLNAKNKIIDNLRYQDRSLEINHRNELLQEKERLYLELKTLKGFFTGKRKNEINKRLQEIEHELL